MVIQKACQLRRQRFALSVPLPSIRFKTIIVIMDALIYAENLTKQFDRHTAVSQLNLEVRQGEVLAFLGPNGAGKTTTVRMLTSILKPTHGSAIVAGYDVVQHAREVRARVGH